MDNAYIYLQPICCVQIKTKLLAILNFQAANKILFHFKENGMYSSSENEHSLEKCFCI